ncbi:hypothetical protein NIIDNTM18_53980 [Mycolicibacterium litorale]|uniref:Sulfur globule protein n=2 Tax=Mycolicibacterium litorale TaxID=758802 RepID=A0A6S6PI10_9MYCO|nr:hypothetical protein NIIDNTM18_53980 [Mycolicibacterium litorale]
MLGIVAGALAAALIGTAGPAQADGHGYGFGGHGDDHGYHYGYGRDHRNNPWIDKLFPTVIVPHVDTNVRN